MTDQLALLRDMQRQLAELTRRETARQQKGRRRRGQRVYDPPEPPGPRPTELDIARAKRLQRRHGR